jgi:hypothetical protein
MWGLHIGVGFATWINYGGLWAVWAASLAIGDAEFGSALVGAFWLGRALSVWIGPAIAPGNGAATPRFLRQVFEQRPLFHSIQRIALIWSVGVASYLLLRALVE